MFPVFKNTPIWPIFPWAWTRMPVEKKVPLSVWQTEHFTGFFDLNPPTIPWNISTVPPGQAGLRRLCNNLRQVMTLPVRFQGPAGSHPTKKILKNLKKNSENNFTDLFVKKKLKNFPEMFSGI
jgi:hypothetical protein